MNITTKWNVGDTFWVPRVHTKINEEIFTDINGRVFTHKSYYWLPLPKEKTIIEIYIIIKKTKVEIKYNCSDGILPHYYDLETMDVLRDYNNAMKVSQEYADKKEHYYGL